MLRKVYVFSFSFCISAILLLNSCGAKKKVVLRENESNHSTISDKKNRKTNLNQFYAELLGVKSKDLNSQLYSFIDEWMDVPHRMGGMDKSGVDCSGFVTMVYQDVYKKNLPRISRDMADQIKRKYDDDLKEGDLVFFSFGGKSIDHVGIYLHNDKFVHVSTKKGVMISNLKDTWYYKYFTRCGTPK